MVAQGATKLALRKTTGEQPRVADASLLAPHLVLQSTAKTGDYPIKVFTVADRTTPTFAHGVGAAASAAPAIVPTRTGVAVLDARQGSLQSYPDELAAQASSPAMRARAKAAMPV